MNMDESEQVFGKNLDQAFHYRVKCNIYSSMCIIGPCIYVAHGSIVSVYDTGIGRWKGFPFMEDSANLISAMFTHKRNDDGDEALIIIRADGTISSFFEDESGC